MGGPLSETDDLVLLRRLSDRYADAVDRRDGDALAQLFGAQGRLILPSLGGSEGDTLVGDGVRAALDPLAVYDRTFHHVGAAVFDLDGDRASGRVQCSAHHYERTHNGPIDLVMFIVYRDEYCRVGGDGRAGGDWRFDTRLVDVRWTEAHPANRVRR